MVRTTGFFPVVAVFLKVVENHLTRLHYHSIIESDNIHMDIRKEELLKLIVENYIETAEPVGSQFLAERSDLGVSGATVRNEMRELEDAGLLMHPHTSAGRMPTEAGYRYYVDHLLSAAARNTRIGEELTTAVAKEPDKKSRMKAAARFIAERSGNAVIVAWSANSFYYTGISFLFSQPEFREYARVVEVSGIFDQCEAKLEDMFTAAPAGEVTILIGSKNPLGRLCSTVVARPKEEKMMAIVGPMRMNYGDNMALAQTVQEFV